MAKSVPSMTRLQEFAKLFDSGKLTRSKHIKSVPKSRVFSQPPESAKPRGVRVESKQSRVKMEESSEEGAKRRRHPEGQRRLPLAAVVSDCVNRWFQDTLKEAKAGDSGMQLLVGQMYHSGYGVARDTQKGRAWISRASQSRSSVWKVGDKHPGYNASDSDSDDRKKDVK